MKIAKGLTKAFLACRRGATAIEYGLILGLMALAIVGALGATGNSYSDGMNNTADNITDAMAEQAGGE